MTGGHPFDSGGLLKCSPGLTLPSRREHFCHAMNCRFRSTAAISACPWRSSLTSRGLRRRPGTAPAGTNRLTGGDHRRWTHEVRIPDPVPVRDSHLQAVFAREPSGGRPGGGNLFQCALGRVRPHPFYTPHENDSKRCGRVPRVYPRSYTRISYATPWNLDDLEIVGYADVLRNHAASVVPPVFRLKTDARGLPAALLLQRGFLCNATECWI